MSYCTSIATMLVVAVVLACVPLASAEDIVPGMDAFEVVLGPQTYVDFSLMPIPAGFFGPGSDPFEGQVALQSASLDPMIPGPRVLRLGPGIFTGDPATTVIQTELVELTLQSTEPIMIPDPMGDLFFDVLIQLDPIGPSTGQLGLLHNGLPAPGGTVRRELPDGNFQVDSFFDISYRIDFVETCGCGSMSMPGLFDRVELAADVSWSHEPPVEAMIFPETSNFFPGGDPMAPAQPPAPLQFDGEQLHLNLALMLDPHLPSIMGDADYDLDVDLDDFVILKANFGIMSGATWGLGDFNLDGATDLDDFVILKNNFGTTPVVEPTTTSLVLISGLALIRRRRR